MEKLLIDATILAKHFRDRSTLLGDLLAEYRLCLSTVSLTELLTSTKAESPAVEKEIIDYVNANMEVIPVELEIAIKAGSILRKQQLTLATSIIAATAITKNLPLATIDIATFDNIPQLNLVEF